MDNIDKIVSRAIAFTEHAIATKPDDYQAARVGLERLQEKLAREYLTHPARDRLNTYVEQLDRNEKTRRSDSAPR